MNVELRHVCVCVCVGGGGGGGEYGAAVGRWTMARFWHRENSVGYPYCWSMASV